MKTEKEKMLAGEAYQAQDKELRDERMKCLNILHKFNNSIPDSKEWKSSLDELLVNKKDGTYIIPPFHCDYGNNIILGKNFYANFNCIILDVNTVKIGDNVKFGPNVQIYTATHPVNVKERVEDKIEFGLPIIIGDNVWLGGSVTICPGITIGDNSVIGAGSVVTKDIPKNVMAAGNPCNILKELSS